MSKKGDFFTRRALSFSAKNEGGGLSSARSKNNQVFDFIYQNLVYLVLKEI